MSQRLWTDKNPVFLFVISGCVNALPSNLDAEIAEGRLDVARLCERCSKVLDGEDIPDPPWDGSTFFESWSTLEEVARAAADGCPVSSVIQRGFLKLVPDDATLLTRFHPELFKETLSLRLSCVTYHAAGPSLWWPNMRCEVKFSPLTDRNLRSVQRAATHTYVPNTVASSVASFANSWMEECLAEHTKCRVSARYHPPRLLDIRQKKSN